jgi:hypothetical protein
LEIKYPTKFKTELMKKLNFSLLLVAGILASAQSSVTRSAIDKINIPINYKAGDVASTVTAGPSGANVNWDFSAYTVPNASTSTSKVCPGESNCFRFPNANRIDIPSLAESFSFTSMSDTEASTVGMYAGPMYGDVTMTYTDPLIDFKFPITYLQQFTDTYQFNSVSGSIGNSTETGQVDYIVDAYGTIKTPAGTFSNVLRIKRMRTATQTPGPFTYTNESYMWVSPVNGIVFNFAINTFTFNGTTNVTKSVSYPEAGSLSTVDLDSKKEQISIYPNPSSDFINVISKEELKKVTLTSLDGKAIITTGKSRNIDISKLPKGVYLLQGELKNGNSISRKVIKN